MASKRLEDDVTWEESHLLRDEREESATFTPKIAHLEPNRATGFIRYAKPMTLSFLLPVTTQFDI